tara:strand:- start:9231 stop:9641 length:411 start_codon:yes stop_codon:yes gene_type:complete
LKTKAEQLGRKGTMSKSNIPTFRWDNIHVPSESLPKNLDFKYRCNICDKKIPKNNNFCYQCRQEYQVNQDGIFKYNIDRYERERLAEKDKILREDKAYPIRCTLCRKNRVRRDGGICVRCLKFIGVIEEEDEQSNA